MDNIQFASVSFLCTVTWACFGKYPFDHFPLMEANSCNFSRLIWSVDIWVFPQSNSIEVGMTAVLSNLVPMVGDLWWYNMGVGPWLLPPKGERTAKPLNCYVQDKTVCKFACAKTPTLSSWIGVGFTNYNSKETSRGTAHYRFQQKVPATQRHHCQESLAILDNRQKHRCKHAI